MARYPHELLFITKVIETGHILQAVDARITSAYFTDEDLGQMWGWVLSFWRSYGRAPSRQAFRAEYADVTFSPSLDAESLDHLVDKMRSEFTHRVLGNSFPAIAAAHDDHDDPLVLKLMRDLVYAADLQESVVRDIDVPLYSERYGEILAGRYKADSEYLVPGSVPTGFTGLDMMTGGFGPQQLTIIAGLPKAGKTQLMILMALAAMAHGARPLFFTFEMSAEELMDRIVAIVAKIDSAQLRRGTLNKLEKQAVEKALRSLEALPSFVISEDFDFGTTMSLIQAKVQLHSPGVVFVDGLYMLADEGKSNSRDERISGVVAGLKHLSRKANLPVVGTTQALESKTKGGKLEIGSIGYSSAFAQYATTTLGIERAPDDGTSVSNISIVRILNARHAPALYEFGIHWDWKRSNFDEIFIGSGRSSAADVHFDNMDGDPDDEGL